MLLLTARNRPSPEPEPSTAPAPLSALNVSHLRREASLANGFRLQSVLDYRKRRTEALEMEFAERNRAVAIQRDQIAGLRAQLAEQQRSISSLQAGPTLNHDAIRQALTYMDLIERRIDLYGRVLADLENQAEVKRQEMLGALKDQRSLEKLRDREQEAAARKERAREQTETDDQGTQSFHEQRMAS